MSLTVDEKIAHLLRRFGFGAGRKEMEKYRPLGVDGTIHKLIEYDDAEKFPVSVWEFHTDPQGKVAPATAHTVGWWICRMTVTERPLEDKLTMFWHDHFAISSGKVGQFAEIDDYLTRLTRNAVSPFEQTLRQVAYCPAMVRWLDSLASYPAHPNENFGRELMELFTLGIGHYTEKDVQETARCFVGLGIQYAIPPGMKAEEYYRQAATENLPIVSISYAPDFKDSRTKTIRGKTGPLTADDVFTNLANDPATAERIMRKLWLYFVSEKPPTSSDLARLTKVWQKNDLALRPVLLEMTKMDAFWSEAVVRKLPKSPLDYSISMARQVGMGPKYLKLRKPNAGPLDSFRAQATPFYQLGTMMSVQGLALMRPEDVSGWKWGSAWLTTGGMVARLRFAQQVFRSGWADDYVQGLVDGANASTSQAVAERIVADFDIPSTQDQVKVIAQSIDSLSGPASAFKTISNARNSMAKIATVFSAVPDYHLG